ncbi:MAG: hypothetical protein QGG84_02405 [Rhodospirillales bacterium]|nr:hypothetical protein [Rhodospirillales bacterium]
MLRHLVVNQFDQGLADWPRTFAYLPFEHSKDPPIWSKSAAEVEEAEKRKTGE